MEKSINKHMIAVTKKGTQEGIGKESWRKQTPGSVWRSQWKNSRGTHILEDS